MGHEKCSTHSNEWSALRRQLQEWPLQQKLPAKPYRNSSSWKGNLVWSTSKPKCCSSNHHASQNRTSGSLQLYEMWSHQWCSTWCKLMQNAQTLSSVSVPKPLCASWCYFDLHWARQDIKLYNVLFPFQLCFGLSLFPLLGQPGIATLCRHRHPRAPLH